MLIFYWLLCFVVIIDGMEVNDSIFQLKKDQGKYTIKYSDTDYLLCNENIECNDSIFNDNIFTLAEEASNSSIPIECTNVTAIKNAIEALTFKESLEIKKSSKILDHFFNIDNNHFYDMYNIYSILVPSATFKTYFYSVIIAKECLQNPHLFNIKAYMLTLDESVLFTSEYHKQKEARDNRLSVLNKLKEDERSLEIKKELAELTAVRYRNAIVVQLIFEYIRNTFLNRQKDQIENLESKILLKISEKDLQAAENVMGKIYAEKQLTVENSFSEIHDIIISLYNIRKDQSYSLLKSTLNNVLEKTHFNVTHDEYALFERSLFLLMSEVNIEDNDLFISEKLRSLYDIITDENLQPICDSIMPNEALVDVVNLYQLKKRFYSKTLKNIDQRVDRSKVMEPAVLNFFLNKLAFFKNDILDCSYMPIADLIKSKSLFDLVSLLEIDFKTITKIKIFCDCKNPVNSNKVPDYNEGDKNPQIIESITHLRRMLPNLKDLYFMDTEMANFFSKNYFKFCRVLFYPEYDQNIENFHLKEKALNIHVHNSIYDTIIKLHNKYLNNTHYKNIFLGTINILYRGSYWSGILIILWHFAWCKKDLDFGLKGFLLYIYGQWSHFPNIFKMPYGNAFSISCLVLSGLLYATKDWFNFYRDCSKVLDDNEIKKIIKHGQFIFSYDPTTIA